MVVEQIIFYLIAAFTISTAVMMVSSRHPVRSALYLILTFIGSAILWMLLEAEFLSLVLIFVYVGAVMTLFLFVVMMLQLDPEKLSQGFVRYLPFGVLVLALTVGIMFYVIAPNHFALLTPSHQPADYSNTKELGFVLYTHYAFPFEVAGALLLVAMIAAVSLSFRGPQRRRIQNVTEQVAVKRDQRVRLVKMKSEPRPDINSQQDN